MSQPVSAKEIPPYGLNLSKPRNLKTDIHLLRVFGADSQKNDGSAFKYFLVIAYI